MRSDILVSICLLGINVTACYETKRRDDPPPAIPEIRLTPEEQQRKDLEAKQELTKAYLAQSPAFLDAAIDQRCAAIEDFVKQFQLKVFPEVTLSGMSCEDRSTSGILSHQLSFQTHRLEETEKIRFTCSQFSADGEWFCGTQHDDAEGRSNDPFLKAFGLELWDLGYKYAALPRTKEFRIYNHSYAEFTQAIAQKAESEGIDYVEFKNASGFQPGDTTLTYSLVPDEEGDGTRGRVVFITVPQIWFDIKMNGPVTNHLLLDCEDFDCLKEARYEFRAQQLIIFRSVGRVTYTLPHSFDASIFGE